MANTIKIKRGLKANLPTLAVGEQAYCTDTNELFIGTDTGNVLVNPETDLSTYDNHIANTSNPHSVTTTQIGAEPAFTKNTAFNKDFGNTAGTVTQGNDARLSDARTPTSHTHPISDVTGLQSALDGKTTESYVDTQVANLVDSSPATLDTLNELASALGDDPNFATTVSNQIGTKADKTTTISAGGGLTGGGDLSANRTISHADTSSQGSINNSNGTVIQDVTLDTYGHIIGLGSANLDDRYYTESESDARYVPQRERTNWNDGTVINNVVGQLAWRNFGNNHTIFDASAGTSPNGTSIDRTNSSVAWQTNYPTLMGWNGSATQGVRVDTSRYAESSGNANTLDGIDSSQFLRSDTTDTMSGRLEMANTLDMNNNDIAGVNNIFHHGESDTYIGFHAVDQWRVVTGGSERLEVNNSAVTVSNKLVGKINEVNNNVGINFWTGTQAQYDAIGTKDANTIYFVTD